MFASLAGTLGQALEDIDPATGNSIGTITPTTMGLAVVDGLDPLEYQGYYDTIFEQNLSAELTSITGVRVQQEQELTNLMDTILAETSKAKSLAVTSSVIYMAEIDTTKSTSGSIIYKESKIFEGGVTVEIKDITKLTNDITQKIGEVAETQKEENSVKRSMAAVPKYNTSLNKDYVFKLAYQEKLNNTLNIVTNKPVTYRFGIWTAKIKDLADTKVVHGKLHPIEQKLLEEACSHLMNPQISSGDTQGISGYRNNVALVDIFVREGGIIAKDEKTNGPEIHTVVLWKKEASKLVVIDPNYREFSNIVTIITTLLPISIELSAPLEKLYLSKGLTLGRNDKDGRDCTDIAVKVAFEINELQLSSSGVTVDKIEEAVGERLSNNPKHHTKLQSLKNFKKGAHIRSLQSSNYQYRSETLKLVDGFNPASKQDPKAFQNLEADILAVKVRLGL